jgi:3-dehydroquinate synthase
MTTIVPVALSARQYSIAIGASLLKDEAPFAQALPQKSARVMIVSNTTIAPVYEPVLRATLAKLGIEALSVTLPDGEAYKDWQTLNLIFDALLEHACDRQTTIIALGGGVVGDIAGFAASSYQRGIPFIQVPTTLLAQVDSSVGGKTGVNHPRGKNMVGAFYQPKLVVIDTDTLATLPLREFRAGIAEIIKYGAALDATFFAWLEQNMDALMARDATALTHAIRRSCEIKAMVVADDEFETKKQGGRAILNFGHTFGHAVETAMGYGAWLHGEAVACGMVMAADFSAAHGTLPASTSQRIRALIARAGLPTQLPHVSSTELIAHMARDKKNSSGQIRLILLDELAKARIDGTHDRTAIESFLDRQPRANAVMDA